MPNIDFKLLTLFHCFRIRDEDTNRLNEEYQRMVQGLKDASVQRDTDMILANPILPNDILKGVCITAECSNFKLSHISYL